MSFYVCQQNRRTALSDRMYKRNLPSQQLQMQFDPRPMPTRYQKMPTADVYAQSKEPIVCQPAYRPETTFNPGSAGPYEGYASSIDDDSRIKSLFFPIQAAIQSKYVPNSSSSMYNYHIPQTQNVQTYPGLGDAPPFAPFNPNSCNLGYKLLYNHTRQQVKNL